MSKKKKTTQVRQGDVLLMRAERHGELAQEPMRDPRGVVLAEGETSHHHHAFLGRGAGAKLFRFKMGSSDYLLDTGRTGGELRVVGGASGAGETTVDRHTVIQITPGKYVSRVQREWSIAQEKSMTAPD